MAKTAMRNPRCGICLLVLVTASVFLTTSCNKSSEPTVVVRPQVTQPAKHYHLKGKVVSVDQQAKLLNVNSEAIPDFMDAMTMPYQVKPENELDKLSPGDAITADMVIQDEKSWLENIVVAGHSAASK